MNSYNHKEIENKWQNTWLESNSGHTLNSTAKKYVLTMFCYPSGDKLHIGHWYNYGPVDTYARYLKMNGYNVFQPQGFDAFGLPAENYAIKNGIHPKISTNKNISVMRNQLNKIGAMFNWNEEVITCEPDYYKWTQWLFLQLYSNGLAYRKEAMVNWDPIDQTVLANEQVLSDGTSERSGGKVIQKPLKQWFFKITKYAEDLLNFDNIAWPKKTISMQKNWIGKSVGAEIEFDIIDSDLSFKVFTTRPDTIYGVTYIVVSPEHPELFNIVSLNKVSEVKAYIEDSSKKSELQRTDLDKDKTGIFTGSYACNPINGEKIPVWVADYVLMGYGTGCIMAVPAHDHRDYTFSKKYNINSLKVVKGGEEIDNDCYEGHGIAVNSDIINGMTTEHAKDKIIDFIIDKKIGKKSIKYRLKDWLISRQRYWGAPIPIVYDPDGKAHPIPEKYLPWALPEDVEYKPKGTSPLGTSEILRKRTEDIFGKGWTPEIDTMDTFVCSSWYFLRYPDSKNDSLPFTKDSNKMLPVDNYIGGAEHATMHLLYARFITKCLKDLNYLDFSEPFKHLYHQGTITKNGSKMSKSKGNTVSPDKFVEMYGSDTFRCYLMFMGPYDEGGDWNDKGITGVDRFLKRSYRVILKDVEAECNAGDEYILHDTIENITSNLSEFKFNTSISKLMEFVNHFYDKGLRVDFKESYVKMLAPFAPHLAEELWFLLGNKKSIFDEEWPEYDKSKLVKNDAKIAIQVNGKLRGSIVVSLESDQKSVIKLAKEHGNVVSYLEGKSIIKEIYIPGKIINFVVN